MVRIAHIADVHVQDRRRQEYAAVFATLYESLRAEAPDIIAVVGDVFDNKMRASPNNLTDVAAFLSALADIAPVVLIAGNHDTNVLMPGSLDLLTPLLADHRSLQPPRLTYWRDSGVYEAHGLVWTVIATDGAKPPASEEAAVWARPGLGAAPRICLFHEEVNGAILPTGGVLRGYKLSVADLAPYDLAMGGHIHCRQKFTERAGYCGSLVQQSVGEPHRGHGYVLWELAPSAGHRPWRTAPPTARGVDIPNALGGFARVEVDAAGLDVTPRPAPPCPIYWELAHDLATPAARVRELAAEYETAWGMPPRAIRLKPGDAAGPPAPGGPTGAPAPADAEAAERAAMAVAQAAARTLESHEEIITELLGDRPELPEVLALHRAHYEESRRGVPSAAPAGARFRLLRLEFEDMYAFGPGNAVDFARLEGGVSGAVAPNHTGKTSLIDALLFALYEVHPRTPTKKDAVRRGAAGCRLALDFELDGKPGRIEKALSSGRAHAANAQYRFHYDGEDRTQGGTAETLVAIRQLLGGPEAALASSFQLQGGETGGFIGATPPERKKLLAATLGLGSFEALERTITKELTAAGAEERLLGQQYKGTPADDLAASEASERAAAAVSAAEAARCEARALEANDAAVRAAATESRAEAEAAAAAAVSVAAAAEVTAEVRGLLEVLGRERLDPAWCSAAAGEWAEEVGAAPLAGAVAARAEPPPAKPPAGVPTPGEVAAAARLADLAEAREAAAAERAGAAEEALGRARAGTGSATSRLGAARVALARARAGLERARALEVAPGLGARPAPPEGGAPLAPATWAGERPGERPNRARVEAALRLAGPCDREAAGALGRLRSAGAAWDPRALALAEAAAAECGAWRGAEPSAATSLAEAAKRLAAAMGAETEAATALRCLPEAAALAAARRGAEAVEAAQAGSLAAAEKAVADASVWFAATRNLATIRAKHAPTPGCRGCAAMTALLSPEMEQRARKDLEAAESARDGALAAVWSATHRRARAAAEELASAREAHAAALSAAKAAQAAARVAELERAREASEAAAALEAAIAVVDRDRYWAARDLEAARQHETEARLWESENARALDALRGAAAAAASAAEAEVGRAAAGSAEQESVSAEERAAAALAQARAELGSAREAARAARAAHSGLEERRKAAEGALAWWSAAARAGAIAAAAAAAAEAAGAAEELAVAAAEAAREAAGAAEAARAAGAAALRAEAAHLREADRLAAQLAAEGERGAAHAEARARRDALKAYRAVLRPTGGIGDRLLCRARALLMRRINEGLRELGAKFVIEITPDFDVYHTAGGGADPEAWLPATLASGYQKFALNLAARLAIWRLSAAPRPDALVIDEGFGACDEDYMEAIATALETLSTAPGAPRLVFVVSHVEALKARLAPERALEIVAGPGGSRVSNSASLGLRRGLDGAPQPPPAPKAPAAGVLPPDPNHAGNVWCGACQQSLRAGWASKHVGSAKHAAALDRIERAAPWG